MLTPAPKELTQLILSANVTIVPMPAFNVPVNTTAKPVCLAIINSMKYTVSRSVPFLQSNKAIHALTNIFPLIRVFFTNFPLFKTLGALIIHRTSRQRPNRQ